MEACSVRRRAIVGPAGSGRHTRRKAGKIRHHGYRPGIALAWTAMVLFVMVLMVGLSIDWGKVVWNAHQIQNAADAAALAGAQIVKTDRDPTRSPYYATIYRTSDFAFKNWADQLPVTLQTTGQPQPFAGSQDAYDILVGRWIRQETPPYFFPTRDAPNAVRVVVRRQTGSAASAPPIPLLFGPLASVSTANVVRKATAWCFDSGSAGLILLSQTASPGLDVWGSANLNVENGGIQVNSRVTVAATVGGSASVDCGQMNVFGGTKPAPDGWDKYMTQPFTINTNVPPIADPLKAIMGFDYLDVPSPPHYGTVSDAKGTHPAGSSPITASCTLGPGYYPGGINMKGGPTITLDPKLGGTGALTLGEPIYFLGGVGLVANNGTLTGYGVTVYITKDKSSTK